MVRRTFLDPALDADFARYGFVVIPFLDATQVGKLTDLYWRRGPAPDDPQSTIFFDFQSEDSSFKRAMVEELRPLLEPHFESILDDHHLFYPNYIMKWPGDRSGFAPHQDTSLVDEAAFRSVTIWCPLNDTMMSDGSDNGMLYVVPGSHQFAPSVRAHDPGAFTFEGTEEAIVEKYGVGVPVAAGEAVVFDHQLVHFSMPNESPDPRLVIALGLRPADAQLLHFRRQGEGEVDSYAIDDDYFIDLNPFSVRAGVPGYERVGTQPLNRPSVSLDQFEQWCIDAGPGPASAVDRMVAHAQRPSRVNADPFCFRCGSTDDLIDGRQGEHGNVQFLCRSCAGGPGADQEQHRLTFEDRDLEDEFRREGFVVVDVPSGVVESLDGLYGANRMDVPHGFQATTQSNDADLKRRVHDGVCTIAGPAAQAWFADHRLLAGNFVVKQPGPFRVEPHQDLCFVDEAKATAAIAWVPLADVEASQGAIHVVPGSHILPTVPRGSGDHRYPFEPLAAHLRARRSVAVPLRRGQALIYDARLIHWSQPNEGSAERVAAAFVAVPAAEPLLHYHLNPDDTVAVLAVDDDIYADTQFHGFPVRGSIVRVEGCPGLVYDQPATLDELLRQTGAAVPMGAAVASGSPPPLASGWLPVLEGGRYVDV